MVIAAARPFPKISLTSPGDMFRARCDGVCAFTDEAFKDECELASNQARAYMDGQSADK